jgi:hypothetical protein
MTLDASMIAIDEHARVHALLLTNHSLCRCAIVLNGTALEHWTYHRDNALALGNLLLAASYDALISECL